LIPGCQGSRYRAERCAGAGPSHFLEDNEMLCYEVTLGVAPERLVELEAYMRGTHIPEILATGCFAQICFERSESGLFRSRYQAVSQEALDRYFRDHAERLRQDFQVHFPEGVVPSRRMWTEIESWGEAEGH
jgi:hypothetical protein